MPLTKKIKILLAVLLPVILIGSATPFVFLSIRENTTVNITLLGNAGVMLESKGIRIFIDPINLTDNYNEMPADYILITHDHLDHYQSDVIEMLQKESTVNFFPNIMVDAIALFDGEGVNPGELFTYEEVIIETFYMYTGISHPMSSNYTSYIVDFDGFTIFHAGDSGNIIEYAQLTGRIDVAMLPLGPGCQTMTDMAVVDVLETIDPEYFIPIHYTEDFKELFLTFYGGYITNCEICNLAYSESRRFNIN